ncbi:hypothetical protein FRC12_015124 [Ceratobasidium sp. 428]|nr:hypothetical protein FRC12_015124 [Ceratobasidium sp. 428]
MLAHKVGTAAASEAPPLPSGKDRLKPGSSAGQRNVTTSGLRVNGGSRATTPSKGIRAITPVGRATTSSLPRAITPSISRAPTPSPALMVETPDGQTVLPTRDTSTSLTSGSNYSDDDEIVAIDDDEDEIVAVDIDEQDANREYVDPHEEGEDDMRAPSRAGVMLRPDSRMTNATVVRASFGESRTASRMSGAMSAFGGLDAADPDRALSPPVDASSQRSSIAMPKRSSTLMSEVIPPTPPPDGSKPTSQSPPLNVRRSQVVPPLTLQAPSSFASTVASLRSAPPPASTDFFDAVYTRSLASGGGLGLDSDSDEPEPPVPIFVQPRSRAVSTTSASTSRSKASRILGLDVESLKDAQGTVMHFANSSNPYLATDPNPYQGLDPRKPVTNTPPASQTKFRALNLLRPATSMGLRSSGRKSPHMIQHPAVRAGISHESVRSGAASIRSEAGTVGGRAARSEESIASTQTRRQRPNPSLTRLDGLYAMHIEAERDQMKRITNAASSSSKRS